MVRIRSERKHRRRTEVPAGSLAPAPSALPLAHRVVSLLGSFIILGVRSGMLAGRRPDGQAHFTEMGLRLHFDCKKWKDSNWKSCSVEGSWASLPLWERTLSRLRRGKSNSPVGRRSCGCSGSAAAVKELLQGRKGQNQGRRGRRSPTYSQMSHLLLWGLQGPRGHLSFLALVGKRKEGRQDDEKECLCSLQCF